MKAAMVVASLAIAVGAARAEEPPAERAGERSEGGDDGGDADVQRARERFERGDYAGARELLQRAYAQRPRPALLFALGQVELNLGRPQAAIELYERFLATEPPDDERALAQQAIGAARMRLAQPPEAEVRRVDEPVRRRRAPRWQPVDTGLVIGGAIAAGAATGMIVHARRLAGDASGTLSEYGDRVDRARAWRWAGVAVGAAGALAAGAALVHWRLSGGVELVAAPTAGGAVAIVGRRW